MIPGIRRRLGGLARTFGGRVLPRPVILCYHRVADLETDPQALAVRPDRFDEHMEILRREAAPVPLEKMVRGEWGDAATGRAVAVTFDDGYADNFTTARPILQDHEIPATVFVLAGMVGSREEFWWDELERLLLRGSTPRRTLELEIGGRIRRWGLEEKHPATTGEGSLDDWTVLDPRDPSPSHRAYRELTTLFRLANPDDQDAALARLRSWAGTDGKGRPTHRAMSGEELCSLIEDDLVKVGSHALRHTQFADLAADDRLYELQESKMRLEAITQRTVDQFAYPFGARFCLPSDDSDELQTAGYRLACANFEGTVGARTHRFRLPRFLVRDWSRDEFTHRLRQWFGHPGDVA